MRRRTMAGGLQIPLLLALALLAGCAGTRAMATSDPALRLRERVAQYWDARVKGDLRVTYTLHEPAFRRAVTLTGFAQGRGVTKVLAYEILGERIEGDLGIVKVKVNSTVRHQKLIKPVEPSWAEFEEQWVQVGEEWYRKFRFPVGEPYPAVNWDDISAESETSGSPPAR